MSDLVERLRVWADAADEGDRIAARYALGKDADPALTSAMGDDLRAAAAALTAQAEEIARLREALTAERQLVIAFCAPHAARYASDFGFPDGTLHPHHYDILAERGARMDDFKRGDDSDDAGGAALGGQP